MKDYYVPENLDLGALLKKNGDEKLSAPMNLDRFYYLIDHIYLALVFRSKTYGKEDEKPYVPVNHRVLEKVLTTRWAGIIKRKLIELNILEENPVKHGKVNYLPHVESKRFRFTDKYVNATFRQVPAANKRLLAKIEARRLQRNEQVVQGHDGRTLIKQSVESIDFDSDAARQYLAHQSYDTERQGRCREAVVEHFENNCHSFSSDGAGRFYHIFTRCPRDLRPFATFNGQGLYEIDVSDCQPALHTTLYPDNSDEKEKFVGIVSMGQFKQFINSKLLKPFDLSVPAQRQEFKGELFHHVFYGSAYVTKESEVAKVFKIEFPELAAIIKELKQPTNKKLPVHMQHLEASVVIDKVASRLSHAHANDEDFCLISIHDCLATTFPHIEEVKQAIVNGFAELLGFELSVKVKPLTKALPVAEQLQPNSEIAFAA